MYLRIVIEILIAFFAMLGLYGSIRWIIQRLFGSRNILIAIEILTQRDAELAEVLIRDALSQYLFLPSGRIFVLTVPEICEHPDLCGALERYGVSCYVIQDTEENT